MINSELINYVKQSLQQNIGEQDIRGTLLAAGWAQTDINDAVSTVRSLQAVNASAGIVSNYSDNGNGPAALHSDSQTMQEPIIGMVKGLESGTAQFWSSAPKHYAAIFTPERIIFINIKNSAASSVFNGLVGGMVGGIVSTLDEQYKTDELMNEISAKGITGILSEHPDALVLSKNDLAGASYKEGSKLWGQKSKISLTIGGAVRNFYAPAKGFGQFQSLASGLLAGSLRPIVNNGSATILNAYGLSEENLIPRKHKIITKIIAIVLFIATAFLILSGFLWIGENVGNTILIFITAVIYFIFGILTIKMKRWALYISIFLLLSVVAGFNDLAEKGGSAAPSLEQTIEVATQWVEAIILGSITTYLWSIRRYLK